MNPGPDTTGPPNAGGLAAGQLIAGRYALERRIAVGGMGEVWEASDERLGRSVAVKVLRAEFSDDPEFLHRFRIEARTVASLNHAGVAQIHDYGEDHSEDGRRTAYLVMELVRGEPLSAVIARGPLEPNATLGILEQAALALQAAHDRGYVHRDVKPGNILIRTDGVVKLTDFGIAKAADAIPVTRTGMVMGTAHYIAPEQASGSEAGPEGDVYSLGIVAYECLTGHRPFRAENAVAVAMMQVRDAPPPLPDTVPIPIRRLINATLVKDPSLRYADGAEFAAAVAAIRRGEELPVPARLAAQGSSLPPPEAESATAEPLAGQANARRHTWRKRADRSASSSQAGAPTPGSETSGQTPGADDLHQTGERAAGTPAAAADRSGGGQPVGARASTRGDEGPVANGRTVDPSSSDQPAARTADEIVGTGTAAGDEAVSRQSGGGQAAADARFGKTHTGPTHAKPRPGPLASSPVPLTEPLRLVPKQSNGRSVLIVLFVLLTLAAVALAVLTVPRLFTGAAGGAGDVSAATTWTAVAADGAPTAPAVLTRVGGYPAYLLDSGEVRWSCPTGCPAQRFSNQAAYQA